MREFFCYDDDYARSKKTRRVKVQRFLACSLTFWTSFVLLFLTMLFTPSELSDEGAFATVLMVIWLILFLCATVLPFYIAKLFNPYLQAVYSAFVEEEDGLWYISLTPKKASRKSVALNEMYLSNTWETAHSREACLPLIQNARNGLSVKHEFFKKPTVILLKNFYVEKNSNFFLISYLNAHGKTCKLSIPDSFSGLQEYLKIT